MILPWILCFVLLIAIIFLVIKIHLMRKSINEIYDGLGDHLSNDTNKLIYISSNDKNIRNLAKKLNSQLSELRKIKRQYENGDQELKEAITNISHDLRTPLTAIWGYLDLLEKKDLSEDERRYVEQIRSRSESLKQLTEELFRYSVISSTPELCYENVNVCKVLEETILSFEGALQNANIIPDIKLPSKAVLRKLDCTALTRIFSNIINNAIKYSDGNLIVELKEDATIIFTNTARGLSAVEVGKLFDRFYTVDSARKSTGLGLSIAKLLTERMGGMIAAEFDNEMLSIKIKFQDR